MADFILDRRRGVILIKNKIGIIFSYELDRAEEQFSALQPPCQVRSLLTFDTLLDVASAGGYLSDEQLSLLADWQEDPFNWGEKHGFPRAE